MRASLKLNQVILIIIFGQFLFTAAASLSAPLFAIFITEEIKAKALIVGFAWAIYWGVKSVLQLPVARLIDRNHGEIDDYYFLIAGCSLTTIGVFLFYFATQTWHVLLIELLIAIGDACAVPPFYAIFSRHVDKRAVGFEWTLESSFSLGAGSALGGLFSGIFSVTIGLRNTFLLNGVLVAIGTLVLVFLRPYIRPKVPRAVYRDLMVEHKHL